MSNVYRCDVLAAQPDGYSFSVTAKGEAVRVVEGTLIVESCVDGVIFMVPVSNVLRVVMMPEVEE